MKLRALYIVLLQKIITPLTQRRHWKVSQGGGLVLDISEENAVFER